MSARAVTAVLVGLLLASCTDGPSTSPTPSSSPVRSSVAASPSHSTFAAPFPPCPKTLPQLPGYYRRVSHPLDLTGATAATLCTYTRTSGSYEYAAYTFKQRLPVSATQLQQLIAALNEAEPFNLSMAYCPLGTPKAVAIYLRESTGIVSLMTGGGPSCGPLIANGLTLTTRYLTSVLADIGY